MPMHHLVHIINGLRIGGAESLLVTLSEELYRRGIPLTIVTLRPNNKGVQDKIEAVGGRVVEFPSRKLRDWGRLQALGQFLESENVDVMHTHLTMANILGQWLGWRLKIPTVSSLHNIHMRSQNNFWHHQLENWLLNNKAAAVVAVGESVAAAHADRLKQQKIRVIHNAVPDFKPLREHECMETRCELTNGYPDRTVLLAIGRLERQKAFTDLLEAMAIHLRTHPDTHLAIAGDGPLRPVLEDRCAVLGIEHRVQLLGVRHDVPRLMMAADVYVNSSHWEGLPISMLEALSAGLPVVATRVGEVVHVVDSATAELVEPGQPIDLAAALDMIVASPQRRRALGAAGRKLIHQRYSATIWVDQLLDLYHEVSTPEKVMA